MMPLTVLVFVAAFISALVVNAEVQRRGLANGQSFRRATVKSGFMAFLTAVAVIGAYLGIGRLIFQLFD